VLRAFLSRARDPVVILPYVGFGSTRRLVVCGRVLQDEGIRPAAVDARRWQNLAAFIKRLESDEVPGARVRARLASRPGRWAEATTNREGYFRIELRGHGYGWNDVALELVREPRVRAVARVLVPSPRARFGVISDIDDTVIRTNVTSRTRMLLTVALTNARTRQPFAGVAAFYRALHGGLNPVFYVSKSPWNLYAPLVDYLAIQGLPEGPLLLRDFGLRMLKRHKEASIEQILETYPRMKFVLAGDSGEEDPEIYSETVRRHPDRIKAVYIRSVDPDPRRIAAVARLSQQVAKTGCQLVLAADALAAAVHAAGEGLIQPSDLRAVRADCLSDASPLSPILRSRAAASRGSLK
jgi:phosphatidate phosphatase APP1